MEITMTDLVNEMAGLIYERSQMVQGDADDLAWDLLNLIKGRPSGSGCRHCGRDDGHAAFCPGQVT